MKVKLLKQRVYRGKKYKKGSIIEVDLVLAEKMILNSIAVRVK